MLYLSKSHKTKLDMWTMTIGNYPKHFIQWLVLKPRAVLELEVDAVLVVDMRAMAMEAFGSSTGDQHSMTGASVMCPGAFAFEYLLTPLLVHALPHPSTSVHVCPRPSVSVNIRPYPSTVEKLEVDGVVVSRVWRWWHSHWRPDLHSTKGAIAIEHRSRVAGLAF